MFQKNLRLLSLALVLAMTLGVAPAVEARATPRNFDVTFQDCTEFVGTGPVSLAEAQAVVPSEFNIVNADGFALLVVRISKCQAVSVGGRAPRPGTVAQIGITIFPPDGLGDINNYTLTYASNVNALVNGLRANGLPAQHEADLLYEFTRDSSTTGNLLGIVTPNPGPTWHVYGRESDPAPNSAFPFRAIWWYAKPSGTVRMDTMIPAIAFGNAEVSFQTPDTSVLTQLIGGNTIATFSGLSVRGVFDDAEMTVGP
jgi:hypothetical protein